MRKIMIIGSGGSGKSTLAKSLGEILDIPVYHLDAYFWKPGWKPIERSELALLQETFVKQDSWIIDGNYSATMDIRLHACDTIIFLNYATVRCLYGITKRRIQYQGKTRPDMGKDCPEKLDLEFFLWVVRFKKNKLPPIRERLNRIDHAQLLEFTSPKQTNNFLATVSK